MLDIFLHQDPANSFPLVFWSDGKPMNANAPALRVIAHHHSVDNDSFITSIPVIRHLHGNVYDFTICQARTVDVSHQLVHSIAALYFSEYAETNFGRNG